jgi:hypothetical protein
MTERLEFAWKSIDGAIYATLKEAEYADFMSELEVFAATYEPEGMGCGSVSPYTMKYNASTLYGLLSDYKHLFLPENKE